ncbi:MAG TPA: SDR family NAD(P)-dependent oxidoreductase, partial [Acidobacteriota bacterium]|nr:SDR family NAD(P)-dependent oxidoreductase [Acidobacteriota bacterium]
SIAVSLAERGAGLCLTGRNQERLNELADCLKKRNASVWFAAADLIHDEEVRRLADRICNELGRLDVLIHSAGAIVNGEMSRASVDDFDYQYRINVRAPFLLTQILLPLLKESRGEVVFINSSAGLRAVPGAGQYAATKHALKAVADAFRAEVNSDGVRVLSIYPGRTATPMQASICEMEGKPYHPELLIQPADVALLVVNALETPRSVEITDLSMRPMVKSY